MKSVVAATVLPLAVATPATPHWFTQTVDHFSSSTATFQQRFYANETHFKGPGSPFFVILGGEGGIPPETGIYYPWVTDVLAAAYGALVLEPEHRFYGESLPFGEASFTRQNLRVMNSQQALADTAAFIRAQQALHGCTARGTPGYCPVLTIGGSYPGFLSAMMRLRYPAVVDMAYAASAPVKFYTQEVNQYDYYDRITASAERAMAGCPQAVLKAFTALQAFFQGATAEQISERFTLCKPRSSISDTERDQLSDNILFLAEQTFANLNMANYPPGNTTALHQVCSRFVAASTAGEQSMVEAIRGLLVGNGVKVTRSAGRAVLKAVKTTTSDETACLDLDSQLPAGDNATARCGDWSGCGSGRDGEMWDYQTCTFEVEKIGFGSSGQMFPERQWTTTWLKEHCESRFGVTPQPRALADLWGFDEAGLAAQASRIVFTNGLNDGWSVGGILRDLAPERGLVAINMPNGAHHSDLNRWPMEGETPDVTAAHERIINLVEEWLHQVRQEEATVVI